jgi:hypothetical protein
VVTPSQVTEPELAVDEEQVLFPEHMTVLIPLAQGWVAVQAACAGLVFRVAINARTSTSSFISRMASPFMGAG